MIALISSNLTSAIKNNVSGITQEKCEIINYGIYLFISDSYKIVLFIIASYFLGILDYALISLVSAGILRTFAGGVHAKTQIGCLSAVFFLNYSIIYLSFALNNLNILIFCTIIFFVCLPVLYKYAPCDIKNKPIVSKKQRSYLRKLSFVTLLTLYIIAVIINSHPVSCIIMLSALSTCTCMLPAIYRLTKNENSFIKKDILT